MSQPQRRFVVIPAGGTGTRMGLPYPKQLLPFGPTTIIEHVISLFKNYEVIVAVPKEHFEIFEQRLVGRVRLVVGGATRFESVRIAVFSIPELNSPDNWVLIHDAVRPFLDPDTLEAAWSKAYEYGAMIYATKSVDTIKQVNENGIIVRTHDREHIFQAQTPQIFRADLLLSAYNHFEILNEMPPTDEAQLMELAGFPVAVLPSSPTNRKLTTPEDLNLLQNDKLRIGHGHDVHRLDPERPLYLGGILIPDAPGLLGHSDADVAIHALIDAILGAASKGDIGQWFPDHDPAYKGIRSTELLDKVWTELDELGYRFVHGDLTIQAEAPRLAPHIPKMRETLASILCIAPSQLNIKATTTEGLGFVGRREGIAADAVVLLKAEEAEP